MNKMELNQLCEFISKVYPTATFPKEKLIVWFDLLKPYRFDHAMKNARHHALRSEFPPTIADLVQIPKDDEKPLRNVAHRNLEDVERAKAEATEFLKSIGEL